MSRHWFAMFLLIATLSPFSTISSFFKARTIFSFSIFEKSYEFFISRLMQNLNSSDLNFYFDEEKVFLNLRQKFSAQKIFLIADESLILLRKTASLSLDRKLTLINIFNQICYE